VGVARTAAELRQTATEVEALGHRVQVHPADVCDSAQVDAVVEQAVKTFGRLDILINNAGVALYGVTVPLPGQHPQYPRVDRDSSQRFSDEDWLRTLSVNLTGAFYCCRAVAPHMIAQGGGKIVNISSNASIQAYPYAAAYNTSKAGLNMLTRVLALEWAPYKITVNAVAPGFVLTRMSAHRWAVPEVAQERLNRVPLGRLPQVEEIAAAVLYLVGPSGDYVTGQIIHVDGGLTAP
jgi:NAD(P)-dependent dehydrogenase (short-subunit alcohol dehydrogenase family)